MYLGETVNEYGTPVSKHRCDACGHEFTVCPSAKDQAECWDECTLPECESYDESRDMDIFFGDKSGLREHRRKFNKPIDFEAERKRRIGAKKTDLND